MPRLSALLFLLWPALVQAADPEAGKRLFALHCAACHGEAAAGTGALASALASDPADLTRLAERNGGRFPTEQVIARIDGRSALEAHGGAMPVYGWFFEGPQTTLRDAEGRTIATSEAIAGIVAWLEAMQR